MIHMSNRKMTKYKPKGDINNRVSAGVRTQRGLSGLSGCSTNFFAQMLKAELDLVRGRYIYKVNSQMF